MSEFPHLSPGKLRLDTTGVRVLEARNTITGTRVFIISGPEAERILPQGCRVLERHENGALVTLPFRLPSTEQETQPTHPVTPPTPAKKREQPEQLAEPAQPPEQPEQHATPVSPEPPATPPTPKRPSVQLPKVTLPKVALPKLPRFTPYVLIAVPLVIVAIFLVIRNAPSGGAQPSASIAHLVDIEVEPVGLPPVRLVVDSAPKQSGIEPGTVLGSIPKRVVFSHQGDWVVHGEYNDQQSPAVTLQVPNDRHVTIVFPD